MRHTIAHGTHLSHGTSADSIKTIITIVINNWKNEERKCFPFRNCYVKGREPDSPYRKQRYRLDRMFANGDLRLIIT